MSQCPLPDGATRNRPPRPEAGAYLPGIALPDTKPLAVRERFKMEVEKKSVRGKAHFARYRPLDEVCRKLAGGLDFERGGFELVRFWLPSYGSAPCYLYLWCQVIFTVDSERLVLVPPGLSLKTRHHVWLDQEIRQQLGFADVTTLMRRTGLPRKHINAIAKALRRAYREYLMGSAFRPLVIGADFVTGGRSRAAKYPFLTVTASDPRQGENAYLDGFRTPPGEGRTGPRSAIVQATKKVLLSVNAEDLLAIALDGEERLANIMREALRLACRYNRALKKVRLVLDRRHVQWNAYLPLRTARRKIVKGLSKKDPEQKKQRRLLAEARYDLEEAPDYAVEADTKRRKRLARVFKLWPLLKELYEAFNGIRRIYSCPGAESAARAFEVWKKGLSRGLKQRYGKFVRYIKKCWQMFLDYFAVKEETFNLYGEPYSLTTGFTEAMNREFKWRRSLARASSPDMLAARMISAFEYDKIAPDAALARGRAARREENEAQPQQKRHPAIGTGCVVDLAAEADLAADAAFLQSLTCAAARAPGLAA